MHARSNQSIMTNVIGFVAKAMINKIKCKCMLWFMLLLLWPTTKAMAAAAAAATGSNAKPNCPGKCGNVTVPYPFGIDQSNCGLNEDFVLKCDRNSSSPKLMFRDYIVLNISVEDGTLLTSIPAVNKCYNGSRKLDTSQSESTIDLGGGPFRFSDKKNKLTAFGCDTVVLMGDSNGSFITGCVSLCTANKSESVNRTENSCSGMGCCQTPLAESLKSLDIVLDSVENHKEIGQSMPCDYAFLADETFDLPSLPSSTTDGGSQEKLIITSNVTIEWVVKEATCETIRNSTDYACRDNTDCIYSQNGEGYRCACKQGFQGNPYLGCHDINECKEPAKYKCKGTCKNAVGNYTCKCPLGMYGDGKVYCRGFSVTTIVIVIGAIIFTLVVVLLIFIASRERRKERKFLRNGGIILKHQRVRIFSTAELAKATKNYDKSQFLGEGGFGSVNKGVLPDNTPVAVKKPKEVDNMIQIDQGFQHELRILFQINHKNVVKILGLCLQTRVPLLVYEFVSHGTLSHLVHDKSSQILKTWKNCLRVAVETARALDYFHSLASPTIIHGDVKSTNIPLDENYTVKVADFGASVLLSREKTIRVSKIQGTLGYLDPEYLITGILTEKSDVYSYGVVLVELLTGLKPGSCMASNNNERINIVHHLLSSIENNNLFQIQSFEVADEGEMKEVEIVGELAATCVSSSGITRPKMKEVAEELERLKKLNDNLVRARENIVETQHVLGERELSTNSNAEYQTAMTYQPEDQTVMSLNTENYYCSM